MTEAIALLWRQLKRLFIFVFYRKRVPIAVDACEVPAAEPCRPDEAPEELSKRLPPPDHVQIPRHRRGKFMPKAKRERTRTARKAPESPKRAKPKPAPLDEARLKEALRKEELGEFYFRDTILDQLDRYFVYIKRMKLRAPDDYALYSKLGAHIVPLLATHFFSLKYAEDNSALSAEERERRAEIAFKLNEYSELTAWWKLNRPGFGAIVYKANSYGEQDEIQGTKEVRAARGKRWGVWYPKFFYFHKYKLQPREVQPAPDGWDIYVMTTYWDKPYCKGKESDKGGVPQEYGIAISPDGSEVRVLKSLAHKYRKVYCRRGPHRGEISIPETCWCYGDDFQRQARDAGLKVEEFLKTMFIETASHFEQANSGMIRIAAKKDGLTATFAVDVQRLPYFFQDRQVTLNEKGTRRPVFHIVRAHERISAGGTAPVRLHFRGERMFSWGDYQVEITVPGLHHRPLQECDVGGVDADRRKKQPGDLTMKKFAALIDTEIMHPKRPPGVGHTVTGQVLPARRAAAKNLNGAERSS